MCAASFPSSPLVTSKRINFHRKATETTSSLLSSVHTYFHGSTPKQKAFFLSQDSQRPDACGRAEGGREGGANGNGTTGEEKKQKKRGEGGGYYSDYVDCPAGRGRLPNKASWQCHQRGCVTSPIGVPHSMARVLRDHRRARLLQSPCAAHLAAAGGVELERVGLMAGLLARLGDIRRKEGRKEGRRGSREGDRSDC